MAAFPVEQGYLFTELGELRVRRKKDRYFLTVKGDGAMVRDEWETEIPSWVFDTIWPRTFGRRIEKTRYVFNENGQTLEVDEYHGHLQGLITMEAEFPDKQTSDSWELPSWADSATEVTHDGRFKNKILATNGVPSAD